jgi:hypothetical protein
VFIGGKIVSSYLGIFFSEEDGDAAYAPSAPLAKRAVANRHAHRLAFYTVSMCPAKAATLMYVGHKTWPPVNLYLFMPPNCLTASLFKSDAPANSPAIPALSTY